MTARKFATKITPDQNRSVVITGSDAQMLALARARYDAAAANLNGVKGDALIADLKLGGVARVNSSSALFGQVAGVMFLVDRMRVAAATIESLERKYGLPNKQLILLDRVVADARWTASSEIADMIGGAL